MVETGAGWGGQQVLAYESWSLCVLGTIPVLQGLTFTLGISSPQETEKAKGQSTWEVAAFKETLPLLGDTYWGRRKRERRREKPLSG